MYGPDATAMATYRTKPRNNQLNNAAVHFNVKQSVTDNETACSGTNNINQ